MGSRSWRQFHHINAAVKAALAAGEPVIGVDTRKKDLVGPYDNGGREYRPRGEPEQVSVHDFIGRQLGKAVPYGVCDVGANTGWVNVGVDHDTAAFAVNSVRIWWDSAGKDTCPGAAQLLIAADCGGSNGNRVRLWKTELAALAAETGLTIKVCHHPPGTSRWNRIEHTLFSFISMNWRGRPLTGHEVIINSIGAATTRTGLKVQARLDESICPEGVKIGDRQMRELETTRLTRDQWHGEWNYSLPPYHTR